MPAKMSKERAIMFMDQSLMYDIPGKYWELTRGEILAQSVFSSGGDGVGCDLGNDDGEHGNA